MLLIILMATTIQDILTQISQGISQHTDTPILDAQVLVAHILGKPRAWVLAHPEAQIKGDQYKKIIQASEHLEHGEPLPYVIGSWEFFGLDFYLTPAVLIPRPETELIVEFAIKWLQDHPNQRNVIDVGTGSGCIGISLAMSIPDLTVLMTDISPNALNIAQVNAHKFGLTRRLEFKATDLLDGIVGRFDLICANLPYIPSHNLNELVVSDWEPRLALNGGENGTELIARLLYQARGCLTPGGLLLLEIESSQGVEVKNLAHTHFPAARVEILNDLSGQNRCLKISSSHLLVHICQRKEWLSAQEQGIYISYSFNREGFIHCSQPQQILQVANTFYRGVSELVLCWIDPGKVTSEIKWEVVDEAIFPHIYGPINLDSVISVTDFIPDEDGTYRMIELPG
jgi:release factor glutamine methyltransferase